MSAFDIGYEEIENFIDRCSNDDLEKVAMIMKIPFSQDLYGDILGAMEDMDWADFDVLGKALIEAGLEI